jgi:hypothetical protein
MIYYILGLNTAMLAFLVVVAVYMIRTYNTLPGATYTTAPARARVLDTIKVSFPRGEITSQYKAYRSAGYKVIDSCGTPETVTLTMVKRIDTAR